MAVEGADRRYRTLQMGLLGLAGCLIAIVGTTPAEPITTRKLLALCFGLYLAFVGFGSVYQAARSA